MCIAFGSGRARRTHALSILVCLSGLAVPGLAQVEQATITGTITDNSGASVPRAAVSATNIETQTGASTESTSDGSYRLPFLPPGTYSLRVEKAGFGVEKMTGVELKVGQTATIPIVLKPGAVSESVTVTASAVLLEQQSSSLGNVVSRQQILELPTGRNAFSLVTLAPGVLPSGNAGTGPIVSGGRSNTSAVLFDGQESRNTTTNDISYGPPLESVGEFRIITNNFSAEYGRSGGGILTAAGVTGTNQFHGALYEFLKNDKLNANGWTNNRNGLKINPVRHNEYGIAVGGPALLPRLYNGRNRTFFFFNWEQIRDRSPDNLLTTVPTALQRNGDFSQTTTTTGQLIKIYDPQTTRPDPNSPGNYIRDQFPGNIIPRNRIDPIALKLLSFYPLPTLNTVTNNLPLANTKANNQNKLFQRVDQNFGYRNRLFVRYGYQVSQNTPQFTDVAFPGEGANNAQGTQRTTQQSAVASDTMVFRPDLIAEFRLGFTRGLIEGKPRSAGFDFTSLGLPQSLKAQSLDLLFPLIEVTDITGLGPARSVHQKDAENTPEAQAHVTWLHASHSVKTGFDYLFAAWNIFRPGYPSGDYQFGRGFTQGPNPAVGGTASGYGVATLLLGAPTGGTFTIGPALAASQKSYNWYLQDDWKATRRLTLNLGVRYEYQTPWSERFNNMSYFNPTAIDPLTKRPGILTPVGTSGESRYISDPQKTNFAPRFGLAYTLNDATVIRAGYGWFFFPGSGGIGSSPSNLGSGSEVSTSPYFGPVPAAPNTPVAGASLANPFVTGVNPFPSALVGNSISAEIRDWKTPFNQMWNFNLQRTVLGSFVIEAAYVGSRGEHIFADLPLNALDPKYLSLGSQLNSLVANPFYGTIASGTLSSPTVRLSQMLLPFPQYTGVTAIRRSVGDSIYHALTLRAEKRFSRGLLFQSSYTFGKLIDDVPERFGGRSSINNPYNLAASRAISDNDRSQVSVTNFVYELPFGHGKPFLGRGVAGSILGNWQASGILTLENGQPVVIQGPNNTNAPGLNNAVLRLHDPRLSSGQTIDRWFDITAFAATPAYSFGNDSRTQPNLRNPGLANLDLGLSRSQPIGERARLQFRAEMYNSINHVNFGAPSNNVSSANFGQITTAGAGRTMQMGLRLSY